MTEVMVNSIYKDRKVTIICMLVLPTRRILYSHKWQIIIVKNVFCHIFNIVNKTWRPPAIITDEQFMAKL